MELQVVVDEGIEGDECPLLVRPDMPLPVSPWGMKMVFGGRGLYSVARM